MSQDLKNKKDKSNSNICTYGSEIRPKIKRSKFNHPTFSLNNNISN
jgi:hypothetical protein